MKRICLALALTASPACSGSTSSSPPPLDGRTGPIEVAVSSFTGPTTRKDVFRFDS